MKAAVVISLWAAAWLLGGCVFEEEVAGGEDFPNTLQPLAKVAADHISSHTQWDQFQDIPAVPNPQLSDTLQVPLPTAALAKTAKSLGDSITWDYSDTAADSGGVARKIMVQSGVLKLQRDTLTYRWDLALRDSVVANELLLEVRGFILTRLSGKLQVYRYVNLDSAGNLDQVDYGVIQKGVDSALHVQHWRVLAGADGDLNTSADNQVVQYEFLRIRNLDTLEWTQILDADHDGVLWSYGDSGIVELRQRMENPALKPQVAWDSLSLKVKIYRKGDSTVPLAYYDKRILKTGNVTVFSAKGIRGDSLLVLGDTALVTLDQTYPEDVSQIDSHGRFWVRLADQPWQFKDNTLLHFGMDSRWRDGVIRRAVIDFAPDAPVVSGQIDIQGGFTLALDYDDGGTGAVIGSINNGQITAALNEVRKGLKKAFHLAFDAAGKLLSVQALP